MLRARYLAVMAGRYSDAGVPPPASGPSVYRRLASEIATRHGLDPFGDPETIARAEGIRVVWGITPQRHGLHYGNTIIVSPARDPLESALCLHHERAHYWYRALGTPIHTESDVIWLTIRLACPSEAGIPAPFCPRWLLRAGILAPSR